MKDCKCEKGLEEDKGIGKKNGDTSREKLDVGIKKELMTYYVSVILH